MGIFSQTCFKYDERRIDEAYPRISCYQRAYQVIDQSNYSVEEMNDYYRYDMKADEIKNRIAAGAVKGKVEGLMEGLAEGEAKGKAETIRNMVLELSRQGVDKSIIATATKLSLEETERLTAEFRS